MLMMSARSLLSSQGFRLWTQLKRSWLSVRARPGISSALLPNICLRTCLTKTGKLGDDLLTIVRTGVYQIPGGVHIRDSTKMNIKTWQQLINAEAHFTT